MTHSPEVQKLIEDMAVAYITALFDDCGFDSIKSSEDIGVSELELTMDSLEKALSAIGIPLEALVHLRNNPEAAQALAEGKAAVVPMCIERGNTGQYESVELISYGDIRLFVSEIRLDKPKEQL